MALYFKSMIKHLHRFFILIIFCFISGMNAYSQQNNPVTVYAPSIEPPYSPYISDYFSPSSTKWKTVVTFNDVFEPTWDVRLRITMESNKVRIQTRSEFIPPAPITLWTGETYTITGVDLAPYFQYNALNISGIAPSEISQNGRLPEGFYSFCIEVLDYKTGTSLSQRMCSNIWIQLNDEPITVTPMCGAVVRPNPTQNIPFQWHQSNMVSPNSLGTEYQLTLYEITDLTVNPLNAIQNNKVLKIFESEWVMQNSYLYDMTAPILDIGKKYTYTIQARDIEGKDLFKNKGKSQACWFWYGYPEGGTISLKQPSHFGSFGINEAPNFKWTSPDNVIPGQFFNYHIKIVKLDSAQTPEDAMIENPVWHQEYSVATNKLTGFEVLLNKKFEAKTNYAWQVSSLSEGQLIAVSPVYAFYGPPLIDKFNAGMHEVLVKSTSNRDLNSLSGVAIIKLSKEGKTQEVNFYNLRIIDVAGRYVLNSGSITADLEDTTNIELKPNVEDNLFAYYHPRKLKLDKKALEIYGHVTWSFPHAITSFKEASVVSNLCWINYDNFTLSGNAILTPYNRYELLDPYKFELNLFTSSDFLIDDNIYNLRFTGEVVLPDMISGSELGAGKVRVPFLKAEQLYYISNEKVKLDNNILPLQNSNLVMNPTSYIIDLSEIKSPLKLTENTFWKGVYFPKFRMDFNTNSDLLRQLIFEKPVPVDYELTLSDHFKNWIGSDGLNFLVVRNFPATQKATFNKFPAVLNTLTIDIEKNSVQNSSLTGSILIPFISNTEKNTFTCPISNNGFEPGYLDNLDGKSFAYNKDGVEQMVNMTITRAVFADRERLDMTLDLDWPSLHVSITSLTGFKAYGDYNIGFIFKNGTMALPNQAEGSIGDGESKFPVIYDGIGAGSSNGAYAFGLTGKAVIAEDVSGPEGPPVINIYSTVPNPLLPQTKYVASENPDEEGKSIPLSTSENSYEENIEIIKNDLVDKIYQSTATTDKSNETLAGIEVKNTARDYAPAEYIEPAPEQKKDGSWANVQISFNQEALLDELLAGMTIVLAQPITGKITAAVDAQVVKVTSRVDKLRDSINAKVDRQIHKIIDSLALKVAEKLKKEDFDPTQEVLNVGDTVAKNLSIRIRGNISNSINNNITNPFRSFFSNEISGRSNAFIEAQVRSVILDLMNGKLSFNAVANNVADNLPLLLHGMGDDAFAMINMNKMSGTVANIGRDAMGDIRISEIDKLLLRAVEAEAAHIVGRALSNKASEAANNLANKILGGEGDVAASVGLGVKMNFENLGRNLKEGKIDKIVKLDAVAVKLETKFIDFGGIIHYTANDPVFGDIWKGGVALNVKIPKKFVLQGVYINGRKGDMPYWFAQISGVDEKGKVGDPMSKSPKPLSSPVNLGPVELVAASGRLYHHMTDVEGRPIVPDINTTYGAGVSFVVFDVASHGKAVRLGIGANVEIKQDGHYIIDFVGDIGMILKNPSPTQPDATAMGAGGVDLHYNSRESHFLGKGWVLFNKGICAKGNFMVDVKPGYWAVEVGTRDNMIMITPGCAGWGAAGWAGVNQTTANLGLGLTYSIHTRFGFSVGAVSGGLNIDAGMAAGVQATIQYKPTVKLIEAGIWVELWAGIGIDYSTAIKSGYIQLVDIRCSGDLKMRFDPPPTLLTGNVRGHIDILCIGIDFDAGIEKTL